MKAPILSILITVVLLCAGPAWGETFVVELPGLYGDYRLGSLESASFDLGTYFRSISEARIQCSGTISPGQGHGDGVLLPSDYYFDWPTYQRFTLDSSSPVDHWRTAVGPYSGSFSAEKALQGGLDWTFLLDGRSTVWSELELGIVLGGMYDISILLLTSSNLTDVSLIVEGVPAPAFPGDANQDDLVDIGDLAILGSNYGTLTGMTWAEADFNGDGAVDIGDLAILGQFYGTDVSGGAGGAVPEPGTIAMLALAGLALARRLRTRRGQAVRT